MFAVDIRSCATFPSSVCGYTGFSRIFGSVFEAMTFSDSYAQDQYKRLHPMVQEAHGTFLQRCNPSAINTPL
jgi:hypothetical protein